MQGQFGPRDGGREGKRHIEPNGLAGASRRDRYANHTTKKTVSKDYLNDSVRDRFAPGRLDNRCTVPASRTIELERENARLSNALGESNAALAQLQAEFQVLKQQLDWFRRQLFGEKSEKRLDLDPVEQGNLLTGLGVETPPGLDEPSTHTVTYERRSKVRDGAVNGQRSSIRRQRAGQDHRGSKTRRSRRSRRICARSSAKR